MKFLILFLTLSSLVCRPAIAGENPQKAEYVGDRTVLGVNYNSLLYKAVITFRDYQFSGLVLIKNQEKDSAVHVVFMSEFGLTMLDVKYKNDVFELVSGKEFLSSPRLLEVICDDFRIVLQDFGHIGKYKDKETCREGVGKVKFAHLSGTFIYLYRPGFKVEKATWRKNLARVVKVFITRDAATLPQKIRFTHRGVSLEVNMELINYKQ
ncbi:MAG: hypothetical protein QM786_11635 [Breznakibacter sp.]